MHFAFVARMLRLGTDQCIGQTLVVALAMVMRQEESHLAGGRLSLPRVLAAQSNHPPRFLKLKQAFAPQLRPVPLAYPNSGAFYAFSIDN
jgi:hypothetical protein